MKNSNKSNWKTVKFGDIVRQCQEKVDRDNNPFESYVTGGHMNSEDIHIHQWGTFGDDYVGPAFHRIFRKNQVLYGSRRTYLKKVAVAHFDGITANTTLVCETKDQKVFMQELLPFLMLTDDFTEHSIRESKGSTNPYINWSDIAKYEFHLPPITEQKRIAEILWAADEAMVKCKDSLLKTETIKELKCEDIFKKTKKLIQIKDLIDQDILYPPQDGNHGNSHPKAKDFVDTGIPFVMANNIANNTLNLNTCNYLSQKTTDRLRIGFSVEGDILLSHKGTVGEVAIVPQLDTQYVMLTPQVTYYRTIDHSKLNPKFLFYCFQSKQFQRTLERFSAQSTRAYIGITAQRKLKIPFPSINIQNEYVKKLEIIDAKTKDIQMHLLKIKQTNFSCLNSFMRM